MTIARGSVLNYFLRISRREGVATSEITVDTIRLRLLTRWCSKQIGLLESTSFKNDLCQFIEII